MKASSRLERAGLADRRLWAVIALAVLAIGIGIATSAEKKVARSGKQEGTTRAVPVNAVPARKGDVGVYLDAIGTVTPLANVTVRTRVDGELVAVHFREGQEVQAGDVLAEIDPRPFQVQLEQAEGQLARDQALLANARVDLKRYETLVAKDSIPKQQLDTQASLVRQYEAALESDQAQVDQAKLQLDYARITAPTAGRLGLRLVDQGNIVHASDPGGLVVLTQMRPISVVFALPEDDLRKLLPKLRAGQEMPVEAWDRDSQRELATGSVLTIDNAIDPTTGTVRVKALFPNDDESLFPNQFVNARLLLETHRDATLVPSSAVQHGTEGEFLYVVNADGAVELRSVGVGPEEDDTVAIEKGLAPGELVVIDGTQNLRAGTVVTLQTGEKAEAEAEAEVKTKDGS